ncbi:hypothetical protein ACH4LN_11680 [Streptomyces albus]|uniref:Uncharacterized protein n=1 Tax=Streptomyces albus TaxID=1888 RepID=A0A6C1C080_9ACTN|nr:MULTISPECIES: hypothetical protein [Streptomyces]KPC93459.1 hypothetical protein ADL27_19960 [Streptomyces sp. NRRL F-6602]EPD96457.1 hypothetical protein HMPREF1486_00869 [Streptomyces sp. HPH0547]MDI6411354.1 hypothetical protein [Streptomyces albus]QID35337.1 hypothetical protein G3260_001283 [Streptomyces albus]TGG82237.1 hypothetical protein D8771_16700 [Streptomyces albus]
MADTAGRSTPRGKGKLAALAALGTRPGGQRHPLVAVAMVLPLAALLGLVSGWGRTVLVQASSVAGMLGS